MIRISRYYFKKLVTHFCVDVEASKTAQLTGLNRNTVNRFYGIFRQLIFAAQQSALRRVAGEVELDESYFGPSRIKGVPGRRGRGTFKQPVFGIFERGGRVYTEIVPDCTAKTLRQVILGKVSPQAIIMTDGWRGYDGLVDVGYDTHIRIRHHEREFVRNRGAHINGIESFWSFTKRRLAKFNGVKVHFLRHLKECEWRWNKDTATMEAELWHMLTSNHVLV